MKPAEMFEELGKQGYVGQDEARKAVCLMAYRHLVRLRRQYLDQIDRSKLPPKDNLLLMGPTGCGKSYLVELLFGHILKLPNVTVYKDARLWTV